ncbi:uncharacterized protein BCR38DRAFT_411707 [Pseudomassariella vexata]|uniref:Uncharacterized protein n=1 Tax=Pseudomassariella vexata TaxID=1141098 RepID=A0A1Y2DMP4_9PEZI|nr:uncharacterized protein BCR38DRAFT_411707 [Pseudomassariella vexata]ORY60558.1 hypothetical protein BCR38DRAFT_411707 [Pseudomassariella vexata]
MCQGQGAAVQDDLAGRVSPAAFLSQDSNGKPTLGIFLLSDYDDRKGFDLKNLLDFMIKSGTTRPFEETNARSAILPLFASIVSNEVLSAPWIPLGTIQNILYLTRYWPTASEAEVSVDIVKSFIREVANNGKNVGSADIIHLVLDHGMNIYRWTDGVSFLKHTCAWLHCDDINRSERRVFTGIPNHADDAKLNALHTLEHVLLNVTTMESISSGTCWMKEELVTTGANPDVDSARVWHQLRSSVETTNTLLHLEANNISWLRLWHRLLRQGGRWLLEKPAQAGSSQIAALALESNLHSEGHGSWGEVFSQGYLFAPGLMRL